MSYVNPAGNGNIFLYRGPENLEISFQELAGRRHLYPNVDSEEIGSILVLKRIHECLKDFFASVEWGNEKLASFYFMRTVTRLSQTKDLTSTAIEALEAVVKKLDLIFSNEDIHKTNPSASASNPFFKEFIQPPNTLFNHTEDEKVITNFKEAESSETAFVEINKLSEFHLIRLMSILSNSNVDIINTIETSPIKEIKDALLLNELQYMHWVEEVKGISQDVKMAMLAIYIDHHKLPLKDLKTVLNQEDWSFLTPHLHYVNLSEIPLPQLELILSKIKKATEIYISNSTITKLPDLPNCTHLYCAYCPCLTRLPDLPNCIKLDCFNCSSLAELPALPNCIELECSHCQNLTQLPELPNCTQLLCCYCTNLTKVPALPNCTKLDCSFCQSLIQLQELPNCTMLDCSFCPSLPMLPDLHKCTFLLNCSNCTILTRLPELFNCTRLYCSQCIGLTQLPDLPNCIKLYCCGCIRLNQLGDLSNCVELDCVDCESLIQLPPLPVCIKLNCSNCRNLQGLPEVPQNAQIFSNNTQDGNFPKLIIDQEEFATNPLKILLILGKQFLLDGKYFPNVYYNYKGKPTYALDVGGVRRDCISSICENLFKGKGDNFLTTQEGVPTRQEDEILFMQEGNDERDAYRTLGKILALCYSQNTQFTSGPLFSEETYTLIKKIPWLATASQESLQQWKIQQQICSMNLPECTSTLINLQENVPVLEKNDLLTLTYVIDPTSNTPLPTDYFNIPENRTNLREVLLFETTRNKRLAPILCLAKEMQEELGEAEWQILQSMIAKKLKKRIEGVLNAKILKKKLKWKHKTVTNDKVNKTKTYLTTWIDQANKKSLRLLVRAISGNNSLSQNFLKIKIFPGGSEFIPRAHTCSFTLDLSSDYPSQEIFNHKLNVLLTEGLVGSFQMA